MNYIHLPMVFSQIQLLAFQEVARTGSFTQAAQTLHLTQSALSHRIRNLEEELETALFVRTGSGVRLTEQGTKLLQFCRVQTQAEEEFLQELKPQTSKTLSGTLRVGGVSSLVRSVLLPSLSSLLRKNPEVRLELMTREIAELPRLISSAQVDFLLTSQRMNSPQLVENQCGQEEYVLVESTKKTTNHEAFLDNDSDDQITYDFLKLNSKKQNFIKRSFLDDIYGILDGVSEGIGRAVVPLHMLHTHKDLRIVDGYKALKLPVYLYYSKQPYYTKLHQAAVLELKKNVSEKLLV